MKCQHTLKTSVSIMQSVEMQYILGCQFRVKIVRRTKVVDECMTT